MKESEPEQVGVIVQRVMAKIVQETRLWKGVIGEGRPDAWGGT